MSATNNTLSDTLCDTLVCTVSVRTSGSREGDGSEEEGATPRMDLDLRKGWSRGPEGPRVETPSFSTPLSNGGRGDVGLCTVGGVLQGRNSTVYDPL